MMDRLSNPAKLKANALSKEIKTLLAPLYQKHMDDIISGKFSSTMMEDWAAGDKDLLAWREDTGKLPFEKNAESSEEISEAIRDEETGLLLTRARLGNVTFWVKYEEMDGGYRVHRAYSHRMNIVNRL